MQERTSGHIPPQNGCHCPHHHSLARCDRADAAILGAGGFPLDYSIPQKRMPRPGGSPVVGHRSSSTTLNVYTYVTKVIERQTAAKIDQRIGKQRTPLEEAQETKHSTMTTFRADSGSAPGMSTATLRESVRRS